MDCVQTGIFMKPGSDPGGFIHLIDNIFTLCGLREGSQGEAYAIKTDLTNSIGICRIENNFFGGNKVALFFDHGITQNYPAGICARNIFIGNNSDVVESENEGEKFFSFTENYWDQYLEDSNADGFYDGGPVPSSVSDLNNRDHYAITELSIATSGMISSMMPFNARYIPY